MKIRTAIANIGIILIIMAIFAMQAGADSGSARISGYKVDDINGNGHWDPGEKGIHGWTIDLIGFVEEPFGYGKIKIVRKHTTTDINGFYEFKDLSKGKYLIIEKFNKDYKPTSPFVIILDLDTGQSSIDNDFFNQKLKF